MNDDKKTVVTFEIDNEELIYNIKNIDIDKLNLILDALRLLINDLINSN